MVMGTWGTLTTTLCKKHHTFTSTRHVIPFIAALVKKTSQVFV